jgi:hypothetical protein
LVRHNDEISQSRAGDKLAAIVRESQPLSEIAVNDPITGGAIASEGGVVEPDQPSSAEVPEAAPGELRRRE